MYTKRSMKNRNANKRGKLSNRRNTNRKSHNNNKLTIYRDIGRFISDRLRCNLLYNDTTTSRTHALSPAGNWAYRSSAYDPDPSLGTGAIPGFTELANLYEQYLVHSMTLKLQVANQDTIAYILGVWPSNIVASVNSLLSSDIQEYSANVGAQRRILATVQARPSSLQVRAEGLSLFGRQFLTDTTFASSTSGNPSIPYGINIGFFAGGGANMSLSMIVSAAVTYDVEFFGRRQLES